MPVRAVQPLAVACPLEDEVRLRRGIGTALLLASAVWIGIFYTVLLIIEMYLMIKFARLGPSSLHTGRYHFERRDSDVPAAQQPTLA